MLKLHFSAALLTKLNWKHDQELSLIHNSCTASMQKNGKTEGIFKKVTVQDESCDLSFLKLIQTNIAAR